MSEKLKRLFGLIKQNMSNQIETRISHESYERVNTKEESDNFFKYVNRLSESDRTILKLTNLVYFEWEYRNT